MRVLSTKVIIPAALVGLIGITASSVLATPGEEGCGTVQDWHRPTVMIPDAYGHAFGEDVSAFGWNKVGEAEPNHGNAHHALVTGGYHTHMDHPTPCPEPDV